MPFPRPPLPDRRQAPRRPMDEADPVPALPPRRLVHGGPQPDPSGAPRGPRRRLATAVAVAVVTALAGAWWLAQGHLPEGARPAAAVRAVSGWFGAPAATAPPGGQQPAAGDAAGGAPAGRVAAADPALWSPPEDEVGTVVLAGEMMLGRSVGSALGQSAELLYPFAQVARWLRQADLTVGVLDAPLVAAPPPAATPPPPAATPAPAAAPSGTDAGTAPPGPAGDPALAGPPAAALVLAAAGFDAVSLATDHAMDLGPAGLLETLDHLATAGVQGFGAGATLTEAARPVRFRVGGTTVALLGISELGDPLAAATEAGPGVLWSEASRLRQVVAGARAGADVVIVVAHWGMPLSTRHSARQADVARLLVESGADLVVGSGPGVRQGTEFIQGRPVFYSLGRFVYDQAQDPPAAAEGWVLRVQVSRGSLLQVQVLPVRLSERGDPQPSPGLWSGRRWLELSQGGVLLLQGAPEVNQGDLVLYRRLPVAAGCPAGLYRTRAGGSDAIGLEREGYRGSRYWLTRPGDPAGCAFLPPALLSQFANELPAGSLVRVPAGTQAGE